MDTSKLALFWRSSCMQTFRASCVRGLWGHWLASQHASRSRFGCRLDQVKMEPKGFANLKALSCLSVRQQRNVQVYKALLDAEEVVAIKFLNPTEINTQAVNRERFKSEIQIMQLCQHKNVIGCIGAWIDEDLIYSVCEFASGGDLYTALACDETGEYAWYNRYARFL